MNILVVGPHPDDQELAMGGTICRLVADGHHVMLLDLTDGEPTPFGDPATRAREAAEAARILGVRRMLLGREHGFKNREVVHSIPCRHAVATHRAENAVLGHVESRPPRLYSKKLKCSCRHL